MSVLKDRHVFRLSVTLPEGAEGSIQDYMQRIAIAVDNLTPVKAQRVTVEYYGTEAVKLKQYPPRKKKPQKRKETRYYPDSA